MKKLFKKVMPAIAAAAMALTMVLTPSVKAKAADDPGTVYIIGTFTNSWNEFVEMTREGNGVYSYETTITAGAIEFKMTAEDNWTGTQYNNAGDNFTATAGQDGTLKVTIDMSAVEDENAANAVTIGGTAFDAQLVADDVYYVKGSLTGQMDWDLTTELGKMTESGNTHSITFTGLAAGDSVEYKVLHDPAQLSWSEAYTAESAGAVADRNGSYTMTAAGDLTISIDCTTNVVTITEKAASTTPDPDDTTTPDPDDTTTPDPDDTTTPDPGSTEVGDATPIVAVLALALLAATGVIVCIKKRTVTE